MTKRPNPIANPPRPRLLREVLSPQRPDARARRPQRPLEDLQRVGRSSSASAGQTPPWLRPPINTRARLPFPHSQAALRRLQAPRASPLPPAKTVPLRRATSVPGLRGSAGDEASPIPPASSPSKVVRQCFGY